MVENNMNKTYLAHYGIKGQRWGIRRFQNEDGSLTAAGRRKYNVNEDGTANLKDGYRKSQNTKGAVKSLIGLAVATNGVKGIMGVKRDPSNPSSKKTLNRAIFSTLLGAVVITSGVKNFVEANKNRTFNTTGMGATPETFTGKPKTKAQVLAAEAKKKSK